ncbi:MAG TPA: prephenate dehydrogenase/arogenate dehydrogenase family protein [Polyangiaceae bacterium]|nr:prephenate dehydrogenase/arogenate dehydrogenase family protein [Polyangiaceae bacterium]
MNCVAIYGFGLIGASIAAALRKTAPAIELIGIDLPDAIASAEARALSDEQIASTDRERVRRGVARADLCVLAAPVGVICSELPALLEWAPVVTDCGSTKRSICAAVSGLAQVRRFVPGHPMAGGPEGGAALARNDLFQQQSWLLCPENCDPDALARVEQLVALVGAKSVHLSLEAHDRAVAYTSHAPQLLASALSVLATRANALSAAGPAYRATTRSAGGAERMWHDIFAANADEISVVLREVMAELDSVARGLETSPPDLGAALGLLARARAAREK